MADLKMPDINSVVIAGHLTCDPSFRKTTNGTPVTNFYITCSRKFRDNNGQWRENVCYVGVVAWYKLAESCFETLKRGSAVIIDGELQSRSWKSEDGTNRNVVEIKARRIQFLNRRQADIATTPESDEEPEEESAGIASYSNDAEQRETVEVEQVEKPAQEEVKEEKPEDQNVDVPESDFDFGYRGLKL